MMTTYRNRLDPSSIPAGQIEELAAIFARPGHVALIDEHGNRTEIPELLFQHFARIISLMNEKRAVVLIPEDEKFSTQAAANYLGMSRQHLVDLLEKHEILFHMVGSHRRVLFKDLLEYEKRRDRERRSALDGLSKKVADAGHYDFDYTGEE